MQSGLGYQIPRPSVAAIPLPQYLSHDGGSAIVFLPVSHVAVAVGSPSTGGFSGNDGSMSTSENGR
jgi:hypothetical protein